MCLCSSDITHVQASLLEALQTIVERANAERPLPAVLVCPFWVVDDDAPMRCCCLTDFTRAGTFRRGMLLSSSYCCSVVFLRGWPSVVGLMAVSGGLHRGLSSLLTRVHGLGRRRGEIRRRRERNNQEVV